jgi:acetylornithine deacetylase/succinyl-diaminopimelate desuccinylase-like protein
MGAPSLDWKPLHAEALALLQDLLRIDTTNPPGNERPAAERLADSLRADGIEPLLLDAAPTRTNLIVRLPATAPPSGGPLLLTAHLDVVGVERSEWQRDPFGGEVVDGYVWGRGAIDMKNFAAMAAMMCKVLARSGAPRRRDLIFAAVADEEMACDHGSRFLVENHPEKVRAEYAIGEGGGFTLNVGKQRYYAVQVAEKGVCWLRARVRGRPGHGSMPHEDNAVVKLSEAVARLGRTRLPQHVTPVMREFVQRLAARQPVPARWVLPGLLQPRVGELLLQRVIRDASVRRGFAALLSNTASPTGLAAGKKINVIPGEAACDIDGRTLPGQTQSEFLRELGEVMGSGVELEVFKWLPAVETPDPYATPLYSAIVGTVARHDPGAIAVPYMLPGFTDAKYFTRLGLKWYGFAPVRFPPELRFAELYHGHNERIPVAGFELGLQMLWDIVAEMCVA